MNVSKSEKQELLQKLNELLKKQSDFQQEINALQRHIIRLQVEEPEAASEAPQEFTDHKTTVAQKPEIHKEQPRYAEHYVKKESKKVPNFWEKSGITTEFEQFIGTNLINKIGMIVVIIGVGIGAKYAIDNNLISPLMRILLGYLVGGILAFFAVRLKENYFNFSAVLFSGAMAIFYFISYAAYTYYSLFPYVVAFLLMVLFTVFTVALALYYDRQVIAHFGLAGAYIVPFILYSPVSSALVLFTYMAIINLGILFISTKKQWKPLNYIAFLATWGIFISWFASKDYGNQLGTALVFASLFFAIFYLVFLSYKLILKEKLAIDDIIFLILNSAVFYTIGMVALDMSDLSQTYGGLFSFINALVHGTTAFIVYRSEKKELFYWTIGLVILLITTAIGIQFTSHVITMLWAGEAAFLFWLGRSKKILLFDYISATLMLLTFFALTVNWFSLSYDFYPQTIAEVVPPILNLTFLASFVAVGAFSFIYYMSTQWIPEGGRIKNWMEVFNVLFGGLFLLTIFLTFSNQIDLYWNNRQIYATYELNTGETWTKAYENLNKDIFTFKTIWMLNYSVLFFSALTFVNQKLIKNMVLNGFMLVMGFLLILVFLSGGLSSLGTLRESYLSTDLAGNYNVTIYYLLIRYVVYLFLALLFYSIYRFSLLQINQESIVNAFEVVLSVTLIVICSSELIHWLNLSDSANVYNYGLSILWGVLSFLLIVYGIWKKKKHLRLTSIILFGVTIIKLFVYDLSNLATVPKTIVFVSVGALLLVVSFLYNKYRKIIF
ncbi:DUF2339 domain-containing protein [Maribellus sp. CM-23]|uniref:DUF2339 domain-containing protein n=1 Tax=Maribellus sp. CM-23 TaxID=2781026 RepID=UPI001F1AD732|nr:DUF2339 domain-containing protein [Maribellus sp. CM-23]MCE4565794.1 DUF2339 domain-containing protein [Maribellus sp. CM-23]